MFRLSRQIKLARGPRRWVFAWVFFSGLVLCARVRADGIVGHATVQIIDGDAARAQRRALELAAEDVLRRGVADLVSVRVAARAAARLSPLLLRARSYISRYRVSHRQQEGNQLRLEIRAWLYWEKLSKDLAQLGLRSAARPLSTGSAARPRLALVLRSAWALSVADRRSLTDALSAAATGYDLRTVASNDLLDGRLVVDLAVDQSTILQGIGRRAIRVSASGTLQRGDKSQGFSASAWGFADQQASARFVASTSALRGLAAVLTPLSAEAPPEKKEPLVVSVEGLDHFNEYQQLCRAVTQRSSAELRCSLAGVSRNGQVLFRVAGPGATPVRLAQVLSGALVGSGQLRVLSRTAQGVSAERVAKDPNAVGQP